MQRRALHIAVAVGPDFRLGVLAPDERIVGRSGAVRRDAHDLADVIAEVLRLLRIGAVIAQRQEQVVVRRLHDAAAEMPAARRRSFLAEDHLHVVELVTGELGPRHRGAAAALVRIGETEIDGLVLREVAIERDVMQPALARREHFRQAGKRRGELAVGDDAQTAGTFRHQHAAVGQERERPGVVQSAHHRLDRECAGGGFVGLCIGNGAGQYQRRGRADDARFHADLQSGTPCLNYAPRSRLQCAASLSIDRDSTAEIFQHDLDAVASSDATAWQAKDENP